MADVGSPARPPRAADASAEEQDRATATALVRSIVTGAFLAVVGLSAIASIVATLIIDPLMSDRPAWERALAEVGVILFVLPAVLWLTVIPRVTRKGIAMRSETLGRERVLRSDSVRRDLDARLGRAFELAESEAAALDVVRRALHTITPDAPAELLLAESRDGAFARAVTHSPDGTVPGCDAASPEACPATRRAATLTFESSEAVEACPRLRNRERGGCSAVCIPVAVMGHAVGVLHVVDAPHQHLAAPKVQELQALADQAGNRLGLMRMMTETRHQALTDQLTGLPNRRVLEQHLRSLVTAGQPFSLVMADLDHFKMLNDTHGHDAGDRALRLFATVLRQTLRDQDLVCRWGGEEFTIALPGVDIDAAIAATERVREALALELLAGGHPNFTASFGVSEASGDGTELEELLRRADQALYAAKERGRNRTIRDAEHATPRAAEAMS